MTLWSGAFQQEIGESADGTELRVDRGMAAGQLWVWEQCGQGVVRLSKKLRDGGYRCILYTDLAISRRIRSTDELAIALWRSRSAIALRETHFLANQTWRIMA